MSKRNINEYYVATTEGEDSIKQIVKHMISDGWQPLGGVSTVTQTRFDDILKCDSPYIIYSQVLVKYEEEY
jgi:hypothetical protein